MSEEDYVLDVIPDDYGYTDCADVVNDRLNIVTKALYALVKRVEKLEKLMEKGDE